MLTMKRVVGPLNLAAAALLLAAGMAGAATTSDQAAALVIYPKIVFQAEEFPRTDTIVEIANISTSVVDLHCFYVNATSHCTNSGAPCDSGLDCGGIGSCVPGWAETDFSVSLTRNQPFYWLASTGRNRTCAQDHTCEALPLVGIGVCNGGSPLCTSSADCGGGQCISGQSNAGTSVPPVPEDLFIGELKCVAVDGQGNPSPANSIIGTATIVSDFEGMVDAQSYNAIGVKANSRCAQDLTLLCKNDADCDGGALGPCVSAVGSDSVLILGSDSNPEAEFQACPETLVLDHIFDGAPDPIGPGNFFTDLTLIPCTEDFAVGTSNLGRSTAQFLVFNEFEQRFSSSLPVTCFEETLLSNVDSRDNTRSIFSINVSGTIAGQSRIHAVGSGLLGVARVMKADLSLEDIRDRVNGGGLPPVFAPGAAYEVHQQGQREPIDLIVLP